MVVDCAIVDRDSSSYASVAIGGPCSSTNVSRGVRPLIAISPMASHSSGSRARGVFPTSSTFSPYGPGSGSIEVYHHVSGSYGAVVAVIATTFAGPPIGVASATVRVESSWPSIGSS